MGEMSVSVFRPVIYDHNACFGFVYDVVHFITIDVCAAFCSVMGHNGIIISTIIRLYGTRSTQVLVSAYCIHNTLKKQ